MNLFKHAIFGIIMILSQSIFADTCYDPDQNSVRQSFFKAAFRGIYTYKNLQGWDTNDWPIERNELDADEMIFQYATYSPVTGLHCIYRTRFDRLGMDVSSGVSIDRNIDLFKQPQYIESDFTDHAGWIKDSATDVYKCVNHHVEACAFK